MHRDKKWFDFFGSLWGKLILSFLAVAVIPLLVVGGVAYVSARDSLEAEAFRTLQAARDNKADEIQSYFEERLRNVQTLAQDPTTIAAIQAFDRAVENEAEQTKTNVIEVMRTYRTLYLGKPDMPDAGDKSAYSTAHARYHPLFNDYRKTYGYYDIFLVEPHDGTVIYTVFKEDDYGTSLKNGPYADTNIAEAFQQAVGASNRSFTILADFRYYEPSKEPAAFVEAPIFDGSELVGILIFQLPLDQINIVMQKRAGLGETGETYLVGADNLMRSDSRFSTESTIFKQKVESVTANRALNGQEGAELTLDYRGESVLSAYKPLDIQDVKWVILAEVDEAEAFGPAQRMLQLMLGITGGAALLVMLIAFFITRSIVRPINDVVAVAQRVTAGDLSVQVAADGRSDEVGQLSWAFAHLVEGLKEVTDAANKMAAGNLTAEIKPRSEQDVLGHALVTMVTNLREQIREIIEGVNVLVSSTAQITATTSQLAASAAETATAVNETTATVTEVRQTAEIASQKANFVSQSTRQAAQISQGGERATADTVAEMNRINAHMESIAESIVSLSEQSQTIGQIIATVNDLADQSNLLAVNAAIEAAKAGEQGKGFAVVAQEIKSLAEQSKQATAQVQTILNDIQQATTNSVMTTEQGSKAVSAGVKQSTEAGHSIRQLTESVNAAAQAAIQIATSSQEQLVGVDQVVTAMESIKLASNQNVDGSKQLEIAAQNLGQLGRRLKQLTERYRV
jgi:methyl-accepting chemotaxis protein